MSAHSAAAAAAAAVDAADEEWLGGFSVRQNRCVVVEQTNERREE